MKNRIDELLSRRDKILNIYYTAGYPTHGDTLRIANALEEAGADMLEVGIPFSDPVADGPTIQESSQKALENGMTLQQLFEQLQGLRNHVSIPVLLMGYVNPIMQFGVERFCDQCAKVGVDGVIIPDLPMQDYLDDYQAYFNQKGIHNIFLISPNTSEDRIKEIDENSEGFIYMVASSSVTGAKKGVEENQIAYFERIRSMQLKNPRLIGFGISNKETFNKACEYASGAIIGSAFVKQLGEDSSNSAIKEFVDKIKE